MIQPVKTAIVGCGMISDAYLSTMIGKFDILDVVACCNRSPAKAEEKARKYGIRVLTMDEVLDDASIELVVNLTTPQAHYAVSKQLLEAGKHVYTEKVLAVELQHAAELVSLADQNSLYLGAAPDTFLGSAIQTARFIVDSGMIGEVSSFTCALTRDGELFGRAFPFTIEPGGGIGFDVGIYYLTALLSILGPVRSVSGLVKTRRPERQHVTLERFGESFPVECENLMLGALEFECGTVGTVLFDANGIFTAPEQPRMALFGSMGTMAMADPNQFGGDVRVTLKGNNEPFIMQQSHAFNDECRGLGVAEMAWSLRLGRKHRASKEMAYHALEVLYGIVRSGETGTQQRIASTFEKMPALPRGYSGQGIFSAIEEAGIAF